MVSFCMGRRLDRQADRVNILSGKYLNKVLDVETWREYQLGAIQLPCHIVTLIRPLGLDSARMFSIVIFETYFSYHKDM